MTLPFFSASLEVSDIAPAIVAALRVAPGDGSLERPTEGHKSLS